MSPRSLTVGIRQNADRRWGLLLLLAALTFGAAEANGQEPDAFPKLPELPAVDENRVEGFVEGLSRKEATIEVRLGHGRILSLKQDLFAGDAAGANSPTIAVGDPGILEFQTLSARQLRLVGLRLGSTDLAISTADGRTFEFEVEVVPDLELLRGQLRQTFPDASLKLGHVGDHVVVEGEARDVTQVAQILRTIQTSVATSTGSSGGRIDSAIKPPIPPVGPGKGPVSPLAPPSQPLDLPSQSSAGGESGEPLKILNLLRVPGSQQVLLKVRIAELNRTALRQIGANTLGYDARSGSIFGTQIGSPVDAAANVNPFNLTRTRSFTNASGSNSVSSSIPNASQGLVGSASTLLTSNATMFGIFQNSNFDVFLNALRENEMLKVLAEPNLLAMSGHRATFLAGGEFPVPVAQSSANGAVPAITVNFKSFGVTLGFLPLVLDDGLVRLTVDPEVSAIDPTVAATLVSGGSPVPGLTTRKAHTTVELKQGQTLAIAGLLQLTLQGRTRRIPGLGDLPVLGPFFSNTTSNRIEKELIVLVTPYLVEPLNPDQVPPYPGEEVGAPNDLEFYFLNRIEGRTGRDHRATTEGADPLRIGRLLHLERKNVKGPVGFSD